MAITEDEVFGQCADDPKLIGRQTQRRYKEVWLAYCKWIVERFDKGLGVNVTNFMRISWAEDELEEQMRGGGEDADQVFKPAWRLAEGFEKAHGLQCRNKGEKAAAGDEENLVKCEEINFHKVAIRYSANLSKDNVFACLRHIFHKVGKTMASGREVRIFCGVGDFVSKDRKVEFVFDNHYHRFLIRRLPPPTASSRATTGRPRTTMGLGAGERERVGTGLTDQLILDDGEAMQGWAEEDGDTLGALPSGNPSGGAAQPGGGAEGERAKTAKEGPSFFNGVPSDESWRLARTKRLDPTKDAVSAKMWEINQSQMERKAKITMKNLLLGEERRQQYHTDQSAASEIKHSMAVSVSTQQRMEVERKHQIRVSATLNRHQEAPEDPFFVKLEPQRSDVIRQKKSLQTQVRDGLEIQIAERLRSRQSSRDKTLQNNRRKSGTNSVDECVP
ncbi:hypothetical protein T484DRAFT_2016860 [Baffinella frigidus]|nr:hypothetical protein T484DRAFT_2016860 [Cryptophyta sp. CCMP2293]